MSNTTDDAQQHEFRVHSTEDIYSGAIIAVRKDTVAMPGGGTAQREVVEHSGAVAIVVQNGDQILLIRQYRHPVAQRLWELPAGILDHDNESPWDAAQRELEEETGYRAKHWDVLVDTVTSPGFADESVRIFRARDCEIVPRPPAEEEEADLHQQWIPLTKAVRMVLQGEIVNSIAVAGILALAHLEQIPPTVDDTRDVTAPWTVRSRRFRQR